MITKSIKTFFVAISVCFTAVLTSCNDIVTYDDDTYIAPENQPNTGAPVITGVYEVRDVIYDNALSSVEPGQRIRIHGKNLNHVRSISFNGITVDSSQVAAASDYCVVKVPDEFSVGLSRGLVYTTDLGTTTFNLKVTPEPLEIIGLQNEFCAPGQPVTILGSWFKAYNFGTDATSITLQSSALQPSEITNHGMKITIPEDTPEGSTIDIYWTDADGLQQHANLYYHPTEMMLFGHTLTGSDTWKLETDDDVTNATPLGFPHLHLSGEMPQWQWNDISLQRVVDGLDTLTNRANYHFVFEVLTPKGQPLPSSADGFMDGFMFGMNQTDGNNGCEWEIDGSFDTEGFWQTIRLPLKDVLSFPPYSVPSVHNVMLKIIFQTAIAGNYDVRLANFRIQRLPMDAQLTNEKEETPPPAPRDPITILSEEEHVVENWAGYGIQASAFEQCEEGDTVTVYLKDVNDGAQVVLQEMGNWSAINDSDNNKNVAATATSYSYTLTGEDAYKLKMNGLWVTGGNYTATKVTLTAHNSENCRIFVAR